MDSKSKRLREIAFSAIKLGCIGFGGIAGMVATIENEVVVRRKWLDSRHFLDVVSVSNIVPGPNAVEIVMLCGKERGGKAGLVLAGLCYIFPAALISLLLGFLYQEYGKLPAIQNFLYGLRPAITAVVVGTVVRSATSTLRSRHLALLALLVLAGSLYGLNEVVLILAAGGLSMLYANKSRLWSAVPVLLLLFSPQPPGGFSQTKLFFIFLKIGAILYGSGFVLFAYMDGALVQNNHWLSRQQLMDAIAVGQITPGPILSSATFAGYLIHGIPGAILATVGIFLPSFLISLLMHKILSTARNNMSLRNFLDGLNVGAIAVIAAVGLRMLSESAANWQLMAILGACLLLVVMAKKLNVLYILLFGSLAGYFLSA